MAAMGVILWLLLVVLALFVASVIAVFVGFRMRAPWALDVMRWMTKLVFNPYQMRRAGQPGAYAGVIEHRGRLSGTAYQTPVGIRPTDDGFVIALPYDTRPDWVRNVLAAGTATITYEGERHEVAGPEVLPIEWALPYFTEKDKRGIGAITQFLRLRGAP